MRFRDNRGLLFALAQLGDALRAHSANVPGRIQSIAESVLRAADDETLVTALADELKIEPLRLDRSCQSMRREEIQVDVTGDPRRLGYLDGRRILIPGIRVTVSIPYEGDEQLWGLQPSTFRLTEHSGVVRHEHGANRGVLELVIEQPADEPLEQIKSELQRRLNDIEFCIENQRRDLTGYDTTLRQQIKSVLTDRRARLQKHDGLSQLLGIAEEVDSALPITVITARPGAARTTTIPTSRAWDAFVSHASEDKDSFVRPLVAALTNAGLRVWFDEHELRVGDSLRRKIDNGLAQSRFGIVVVSRHFLSKHWPQKELDGLVAREEDGRKIVLPVWHEISAAEVRQSSPTLADRLAVISSRGVHAVASELLRVIKPA